MEYPAAEGGFNIGWLDFSARGAFILFKKACAFKFKCSITSANYAR